MYSMHDDTGLAVPGFPIRTPPDQSLFSSSPRLIAAGRVLHRRLAPRHPPSALSSLATNIRAERFDASTLHISLSKNNRYLPALYKDWKLQTRYWKYGSISAALSEQRLI